eukprot:TRINITY_DN34_c0_g1_i1.p1 TRINITY_DN34_c0_g1~~TRINITY_DN34_c0_g1_i1.p1  ORF type:complete len:142 (-),score=46.05 TRINITY_DN34_c0_g1_i1:77-502(-)
MRFSLSFLLLVCMLAFAHSLTWSVCDTGAEYTLRINKVDLNPGEPKRGQDVSVDVEGYLSKNVTGGSLHAEIKVDHIKVASKTVDTCEATKMCPFVSGPLVFNDIVNIPHAAPKGRYDAKINVVDQDGTTVICVKASLKLH